MATEKITISVPEATKKKLVAYAHEENLSLSKFLSSCERYTYLSMHSSGKVKIGISKTPIKRGSTFGTVFAILPSQEAESVLLSKLKSTEPPDEFKEIGGKTEWVEGHLDSIFYEIEQLGTGILDDSDVKDSQSERITISAPEGTKDRLIEKAHAHGMTLSKMLATNEYYVLPENISEKVSEVAERYGVTPSDIIVAGVFMYLEEHHSKEKR